MCDIEVMVRIPGVIYIYRTMHLHCPFGLLTERRIRLLNLTDLTQYQVHTIGMPYIHILHMSP